MLTQNSTIRGLKALKAICGKYLSLKKPVRFGTNWYKSVRIGTNWYVLVRFGTFSYVLVRFGTRQDGLVHSVSAGWVVVGPIFYGPGGPVRKVGNGAMKTLGMVGTRSGAGARLSPERPGGTLW